jgi:hypothetical protein
MRFILGAKGRYCENECPDDCLPWYLADCVLMLIDLALSAYQDFPLKLLLPGDDDVEYPWKCADETRSS